MEYPIWELTTIGGGSLIALIAVVHVYVSHLAVGGGLFIWLTDLKAVRDNDSNLLEYVKKHSWFFLLLTMVFGGLTGVGIWFIIALVHPAATSSLIHNYVFGWAIEWVFFVGEITALLVYYYYFDRLQTKIRLNIAFLYFLFAWLSLVVINGILSFMLTPGQWIETHNFWHGFFNPTYFPSLFFRTFMTMIIAGLFGYVTSVFIKDEKFRIKMMRYCSKWLLLPLIGLIPSTVWYYFAIPENIRLTAFELNPQMVSMTSLFLLTTVLIFIVGIVMIFRVKNVVQKLLTIILVVIGLGWMAGFEYSREIARKPYVINQYMYSTAMKSSDLADVKNKGILTKAKWSAIKQVTDENKFQAGREIFNLQCLSCHTLDGFRNDLFKQTSDYTYLGMLSLLNGQGKIQNYMPPFAGKPSEKEALAVFLASLHDEEIIVMPKPSNIEEIASTVPAFDPKKDEYILLVWNDLGMHCISDCDPWFVILPPANNLEAQLIKRGETPEIIAEGIYLTYQVEEGFENPAKHVKFWDFAESNFGKKIEKNVGLFGQGMTGRFEYVDDHNAFVAPAIPVVPYSDDGTINPYPYFMINAYDEETDELLVSTKVVAPVSTEMGCKNCHHGDWSHQKSAGVSDQTAVNILKAHDRLSGTDLYQSALDGNPQLCQSCHADPALGAEGNGVQMNLSASMHGWHANYMIVEGAQACVLCHPAYSKGRTRCSRGIHGYVGKTCIDCHGNLEEHAVSLLNMESEKKTASRLLENLSVARVASKNDVEPRMPWLNEPDCLTCHEDFSQPDADVSSYNVWTASMEELYRIRTDEVGIRCEACHYSTHALYPGKNALGKNRDNVQPIQYSGEPLPIGSNKSCEICHLISMEDAVHHENMEHTFRNIGALE